MEKSHKQNIRVRRPCPHLRASFKACDCSCTSCRWRGSSEPSSSRRCLSNHYVLTEHGGFRAPARQYTHAQVYPLITGYTDTGPAQLRAFLANTSLVQRFTAALLNFSIEEDLDGYSFDWEYRNWNLTDEQGNAVRQNDPNLILRCNGVTVLRLMASVAIFQRIASPPCVWCALIGVLSLSLSLSLTHTHIHTRPPQHT